MSEHTSRAAAGQWYKRMVARNPHEQERVSTPLELLFDLCFVVAVSQAAAGLHHALSANHVEEGILNYCLVFFAIWWAWMNFSWFASAYDTDDGLYRLTTLVQIAGGLVLAAGVPAALQAHNFTVITGGYVIMRLAMVGQWLRVAYSDGAQRRRALRYAAGITIVQVGWVLRLSLPEQWFLWGFVVLALSELLVPVLAERGSPQTWHPQHIAERYGLFTLIVLGESVLSTTVAIQAGIGAGQAVQTLLSLAAAALVIVFSMWWLYFGQSSHRRLTSLGGALWWGYGHLFIFASAAAVGAGLSVAVDYDGHHASASRAVAGLATTVPVAVYVLGIWLLHLSPGQSRAVRAAFPVASVLLIAVAFGPAPIHVAAVLLAALVLVTVRLSPSHSASVRP